MINALLNGIIKLIMSLVSVLMVPIDNLIATFLPSLDNAFTAFGNLLNLIGSVIGWVVSLTGLSSESISLIIAYYTFKLTFPLAVHTIKSAIQWYKALKL